MSFHLAGAYVPLVGGSHRDVRLPSSAEGNGARRLQGGAVRADLAASQRLTGLGRKRLGGRSGDRRAPGRCASGVLDRPSGCRSADTVGTQDAAQLVPPPRGWTADGGGGGKIAHKPGCATSPQDGSGLTCDLFFQLTKGGGKF